MAAKRTPELIPLCHAIPLSQVTVDFEMDDTGIRIIATASAHASTGVEMEAMTAVSIAALTLYDMLKSMERGIHIDRICLLHKEGGQSGVW